MGMGATDTEGRLLACFGQASEIPPSFDSNIDVVNGGVLLALPALLVNGLLSKVKEHFSLPNGFYSIFSYFILLAFMALGRVKRIENLRQIPPGEWGKLIGYDRIPEVRTLRHKIALLTSNENVKEWAGELSAEWIKDYQESLNHFYVDGHVRIYHGKQTELPKHYLTRRKMCMRGTCDYWLNARDGQPFCYISKTVDPGMISVLENEIVPILEKLFPEEANLEKPMEEKPDSQTKKTVWFTPHDFKGKPRFSLICDRESYGIKYMLNMAKKGIACMTYTKKPDENWDVDEFRSESMITSLGEKIEYKIAERYVLKFIDKKPAIWIREIRRLKDDNKQGSITVTDYKSESTYCYYSVTSRWSQENFFGYMMQHFGLDALTDYKMRDMDDTTKLINPNWRKIDSEIRKETSILNRIKAKFNSILLDDDIDTNEFKESQEIKAKLHTDITQLQSVIEQKKQERKKIPKKIKFSELPEEYKFQQLNPHSKYFIDTIKMISYRAETAMVNTLIEKLSRWDFNEARAIIRGIYQSSADFEIDEEAKTFTVKLHHQAINKYDEAIRYLCEELTETQTLYPNTDLKLIYKLVSG